MSEEKNKIEPGTLYLVATPIGNLSDLSERAIKTLNDVSFIACEDTRNSAKLLSLFQIHKELTSYFEHNKKEKGPQIIARLLSGDSCALITDAGMPAISDPGEDLVKLCYEANIPVHIVPGPCACVSALALSGQSTSKFVFEGFLPSTKTERRKQLEKVKYLDYTLIFYEAPHRLLYTLEDMVDILGNRSISIVKELTKINEQVFKTTLQNAVSYYTEHEPRGEFVLIIEGSSEEKPSDDHSYLLTLSCQEHVEFYIQKGLSRMDAIKAAAKDRDLKKSDFYTLLEQEKKGD